MSLYKILEEVRSIRRFQLVQRSVGKLELRMIEEDRERAFGVALTPVQCIHYCLTRPAVASVLCGYDTPEQIAEAVAYETASEAERDYAGVLAAAPRHSYGGGECTYCGHCKPCPMDIDIAMVNKLYDLAVMQPEVPSSVREHYRALAHHAGECVGCRSCESRCPFGVKVAERMAITAALLDASETCGIGHDRRCPASVERSGEMRGLQTYLMACGHPLWDQTIAFAQQCSWRAGPYLADMMRKNEFLAWERVVAAVIDDRVIGFCTFTQKDELPEEHGYSPFIGFVFVEEGSRGHRISEKMISCASEYAKTLRYKAVYLMSGEEGLYEKYGFERSALMEHADVVVIGAGVLGCFAARALRERALSVLVLEAGEEVCAGITKANTGIIYPGCDTKPGTLKTELCVRANLDFDRLCKELDVRFKRCGSLMLAFGPRAEEVLRRKLENGKLNGVPGLRLLSREETLALEPRLSTEVTLSLYAPGTGTVDPWELGIAAFENASANGAVFRFREEVVAMARREKGYLLETEAGQYTARAVVNCAGLNAAAVRELTKVPAVRIFPSAGDYLVLDDSVGGFVRHVISHEPEEKGKGLTLTPTVDGNLLVGPTERDRAAAPEGATAAEGLRELAELCAKVVPELPLDQTIRSFSALRPNPFHVRDEGGVWVPEQRSISNFTVMAEDGLFSLIGIKTPGLTCAPELGKWAAKEVCAYLGDPGPNPDFDPVRKGIPRVHDLNAAERDKLIKLDPDYGEVVCHCRDVTLAQVREAIRRGAVTLDGVKRRTGAGMGACQGGRCLMPVLEALAAGKGLRPAQVTKSGGESFVVTDDGRI